MDIRCPQASAGGTGCRLLRVSIAPSSQILSPPTPANSGTTFTVTEDQGARFPDAPFARYTALIWPTNTIPQRGVNAEEVTVLDRVGDTFTVERAPSPVDIQAGWNFALLSGQPVIDILETYTFAYDFGAHDPDYRVDLHLPNGHIVSHEGTAYVSDNGSGYVSYPVTATLSGQWFARFTSGSDVVSPEASIFVVPSDAVDS